MVNIDARRESQMYSSEEISLDKTTLYTFGAFNFHIFLVRENCATLRAKKVDLFFVNIKIKRSQKYASSNYNKNKKKSDKTQRLSFFIEQITMFSNFEIQIAVDAQRFHYYSNC